MVFRIQTDAAILTAISRLGELSSNTVGRVVIRILPPSGVYLMALMIN